MMLPRFAFSDTVRDYARDHALVQSLFDQVEHDLKRIDVSGLSAFVHALNVARLVIGEPNWKAVCESIVPVHPATALLHLEPLTRRMFDKPDGFLSDAKMIDIAISGLPAFSRGNGLRLSLSRWMAEQGLCVAMRRRRSFFSRAIDQTAVRHESPRILAIGAAYLRELEHSLAVVGNMVREVVAYDENARTLQTVERIHARSRVTTAQGTIARILDGSANLGLFDFIYVPELLHFLPTAAATKLVARLFGMLAPSGRLMLASFAPTLDDIGYMECVMQCRIIYRGEVAMQRLAVGVDDVAISKLETTYDAAGEITFLDMMR